MNMISITHPSTTRTKGPPQVRPIESARLQTGRQAATPATSLVTACTENRPQLAPAGLDRAQTRQLTTARIKRLPGVSSTSSARLPNTRPAGSGQSSTSGRKIQQPSTIVDEASTDVLSRVSIGRAVSGSSASRRESQDPLTDASGTPIRPAAGATRGQALDTSSPLAETRATPTVASALERLTSPPRTPRAPTRPSISPPRTALLGASAGPLRRPSFNLRNRSDPPRAVGSSFQSRSLTSPYGSGRRLTKIGIESEFYLASLKQERSHTTLEGFAETLTRKYNQQVPLKHPRMREKLRPYQWEGPYTEWCLVKDESLRSNAAPWGIEMVSPIFLAFPGSTWRTDVEATWTYLSTYYGIVGTQYAGTHIHVGLEPDYSLTDLKRVAQAVIHFEPAFEALVPRARRGNVHARSNWLDAPGLARKGKSRSGSVAAIEEVSCFQDLLDLLHPTVPSAGLYDRSFAWNFCSWLGKRSLEFRKPPASMTSKEVLSWAELAMSFVQACTCCTSLERLQKIPPTVGGLRWFLRQFGNEPRVNQPGRLEGLFRGRGPEEILEPKPQVVGLPQGERLELEARLRSMAAADRRRIQELTKTVGGRYW